MTCHDCYDTRCVPDDVSGTYTACSSCVVEASATWVIFDSQTAPPDLA